MSRLTAEQKWDAYDDVVIARRERLHRALDAVLNEKKSPRPFRQNAHPFPWSKTPPKRALAKDTVPKYEVRKSRSNDAWAVFEIGDDLPLTGWTNSKAKAMITARAMNGGAVKAKPKSSEAAAREIANRTEHNPTVRNYFKLDS